MPENGIFKMGQNLAGRPEILRFKGMIKILFVCHGNIETHTAKHRENKVPRLFENAIYLSFTPVIYQDISE